jgi:hypothetical protein
VLKYFIIICVLLAILISCLGQKSKVAILYSYYSDYKWTINENNGLMENLDSQKYEIRNYYLDSKKQTQKQWLHEQCPAILAKIIDFEPKLLIVFDDNALRCLEKFAIMPDFPILFVGINKNPNSYQIKAKMAGVVGTIHLEESLELLTKLGLPNTNKVLITDESETSKFFLEQIPLEAFEEVVVENNFAIWQQKVLQWQRSDIDALCVLLYHALRDSQGNYLPPQQLVNWIQENNRIPEIGFFDFSIEDGLLCGVTTSGYEQSKLVGKMAVTYLEDGTFPTKKIHHYPYGKPRINIGRARELGIDVRKLQNWR